MRKCLPAGVFRCKDAFVRRLFSLVLIGCALGASTAGVNAATAAELNAQLNFKDASGRMFSAQLAGDAEKRKLVSLIPIPLARVDRRISPLLARAATIAQERANAHSNSRCWHYVKEALIAAGVVSSRPKTEFAKDAGTELVTFFGFRKLAVLDPYAAPVGAVLVYGSDRAAGHVEIRTRTGFVSDFHSKTPSRRPLIGVYAKA